MGWSLKLICLSSRHSMSIASSTTRQSPNRTRSTLDKPYPNVCQRVNDATTEPASGLKWLQYFSRLLHGIWRNGNGWTKTGTLPHQHHRRTAPSATAWRIRRQPHQHHPSDDCDRPDTAKKAKTIVTTTKINKSNTHPTGENAKAIYLTERKHT